MTSAQRAEGMKLRNKVILNWATHYLDHHVKPGSSAHLRYEMGSDRWVLTMGYDAENVWIDAEVPGYDDHMTIEEFTAKHFIPAVETLRAALE